MPPRTRTRYGPGGELITEEVKKDEPRTVQPDDIDQRADGSLRRAGPGTRTMSDMFAEKNLDRPLTRRDYINLRSSEEYARRESSLLRRVWRWLRHWPAVVNINARMAAAHARDLFEITEALKRKKADEEKLARERAGTVMLNENAKAKADEQ